MKNIYLGSAISVALVIFLSSFSLNTANIEGDDTFVIPDNINKTLQKSCYGCHNSESKNMKGKMKLKLDEFPTMKKSKLISKLSKISKTLGKDKMPPKKFLSHYPEKALSSDEKAALMDWAKSTATKLAEE